MIYFFKARRFSDNILSNPLINILRYPYKNELIAENVFFLCVIQNLIFKT